MRVETEQEKTGYLGISSDFSVNGYEFTEAQRGTEAVKTARRCAGEVFCSSSASKYTPQKTHQQGDLMTPRPLDYATPPQARLSKLAVTAFVLSLMGFPIFYAYYLAVRYHRGDGEIVIGIGLAILVIFSFAGFASGVVALVTIACTGKTLRGMPLAILSIVVSILWPIAAFLRYLMIAP
jgi:hypothetical protein